ncbi:hypothetical protein IFM89_026986 [Coptis chinensis]|uniref:UDP-glycosyltransferase n=1 Tax=Coptis chinensis TaxID=261450 RepID=A0A835LWQ0_9MAGN|nr:hypothetical protein IFM89_026986 [Coptis chinensis]
MEPSSVAKKPHAVCIPYPFQGHITAMLKLAKLLHSKEFHITFVNTEFIHLSLIAKLNEASTFSEDPLVSCIVADTFMSFTLEAAEKLSIPGVTLWPMSASVLWIVVEKILIPPEAPEANCKHPFLWVIRPDLVVGEGAVLPPEFTAETLERSMISGWCPEEEFLSHGSIGGFLTHFGWNSTMDTLCCGVPVICWPGFGDQTTNSRYACVHWEICMEIDKNVNKDDVERILREFV